MRHGGFKCLDTLLVYEIVSVHIYELIIELLYSISTSVVIKLAPIG